MKKLAFTFCILMSAITMHAQQTLVGIWNTGNENTKIEITGENGVYGGKIVASDNANVKVGKQLLKEVRSVGGEWKGKIFSPKKNTWYDAVLEEKDGQLLVTIDAGWRSKTVVWKKG